MHSADGSLLGFCSLLVMRRSSHPALGWQKAPFLTRPSVVVSLRFSPCLKPPLMTKSELRPLFAFITHPLNVGTSLAWEEANFLWLFLMPLQ